MANNLAGYNDLLKNGIKYRYLGKNGIMYEYILKYGGNKEKFYEDAVDVRSIKWGRARRSTKGFDGKEKGNYYRRGVYQPIGHKREFNFYQIKHAGDDNISKEYTVKVVVD